MKGAKLGPEALRQLDDLVREQAVRLRNQILTQLASGQTVQTRWIGQAAADISKGNVGTINLYSGKGQYDKGAEVSLERSLECYARMGDIGNGDWVFVEWIDGGWEVYQAECNE